MKKITMSYDEYEKIIEASKKIRYEKLEVYHNGTTEYLGKNKTIQKIKDSCNEQISVMQDYVDYCKVEVGKLENTKTKSSLLTIVQGITGWTLFFGICGALLYYSLLTNHISAWWSVFPVLLLTSWFGSRDLNCKN